MIFFDLQGWHSKHTLILAVVTALSSASLDLHSRQYLHERRTKAPGHSRHTIESLNPSFPVGYRSQRVKVSYPAVEVPPIHENNGMTYYEEMPTNLPCQNCLILEMSSELEYQDGTQANIDTGMSLHHAVFVNTGRDDALCGRVTSGQRFYASGNERTVIDFSTHSGLIGGYHVAKDNQIAMSLELMNMRDQKQTVVFSTTYEFVPELPERYIDVEALWLDIGECGVSEVDAEPDTSFTYLSSSWTSSFMGNVTFAAGHLHEGGLQVQLLKNGHTICQMNSTYQNVTSSTPHGGGEYIESISSCSDFGMTKPGDEWAIQANYDTSLHTPAKRMDGSLRRVMGISLVHIARENDELSVVPQQPNEGRERRYPWNAILLFICVALVIALLASWYQWLSESLSRFMGKPAKAVPLWADQELRLLSDDQSMP